MPFSPKKQRLELIGRTTGSPDVTLILGIDPGSRKTGFGIINVVGAKTEYVTSGVIRLEALPTFPERLDKLFLCLTEIIGQWAPRYAAIEQVFMGRSADSALKLGQARGVAILAATQSGLEVSEYASRKVKQAVVGKGGADKVQVQHMVQFLLKLPGLPQEDAADALAIALCHAHTHAGLVRVAGSRHSRRGRWLE